MDSRTTPVYRRAIDVISAHTPPPGLRRTVGGPAVLLLVVLALAPRLFVAWTLPLAASEAHPECAPDEGLQFWTVMRYADGDFATWPASGSIYSAFPPVPYALHATTLAAGRALFGNRIPARFPSDWWRLASYTAARLGSVLLGVLTVLLLARAVLAWSASGRPALAAGAAIAVYPQLVFVDGYVNADAYTIAAVAALAAALAVWAAAGEGRQYVAAVGAAIGLVVLGKPSGWPALAPTAFWLLDAWRRRRLAPGTLARVGILVVLVAGPVLALNALRNGGDALGLARYRTLMTTVYPARPLAGLGALPEFLAELGRSSFGVFRNADLRLPTGFYAVAAAFALLALGLGAARSRARDDTAARALGWLGATVVLSLALVVWNGMTVDAQPQGRYLLPALAPAWAAITCVLGRSPVLLAAWIGFLAVATAGALALVHAHPCL